MPEVRKVDHSVYMNQIKDYPVLSHDDILYYHQRYKKYGDIEARKILIESNLKLVVHIVMQFVDRTSPIFMDLIQEGNIGLIIAVNEYDPSKNAKLSTVIGQRVKKNIMAYMQKDKLIHEPDSLYRLRKKVKEKTNEFISIYGRKPTDIELAEFEPSLNIRGIKRVRDSAKFFGNYIPFEAEGLNNAYNENYELKRTDEYMFKSLSCFNVEKIENVEKYIENLERAEKIEILLENIGLTTEEKNILQKRYGLNGIGSMTLVEVGEELCVSKGHVAYIERNALEKIRKSRLYDEFERLL